MFDDLASKKKQVTKTRELCKLLPCDCPVVANISFVIGDTDVQEFIVDK